ncbi:MAG: DUF4214 domain-containing protein [Rhodobacteraceae bacterium]|nr:DUF4214 domain-containing protein [Paracoccaceae bacterium]
MITPLSQISSRGTFALEFRTPGGVNLFPSAAALDQPLRWSLSDLFDPAIDLIDIPPGAGPLTGTATARFDAGLQFTYPTAASFGALDYDLGLQFLGDTSRWDGAAVRYAFGPARTEAEISGRVMGAPLKVELFANAGIDYSDLTIDLPPLFGRAPSRIDIGTGSVQIAEPGSEPALTLYDSNAAGSNGDLTGSRQIVVADNLIDIILNGVEEQAFRLTADNGFTYPGSGPRPGLNTPADILAPGLSGTFTTQPIIDGQLDLDAIAQTLTEMVAAGIVTAGAAGPAMVAHFVKNGVSDYLEISLVEKLLDLVAPNDSTAALAKSFLRKMPVYGDAELVLFDVTANLGLRLEQDISFDPEITYTVQMGDVSRSAPLDAEIRFSDAEVDALAPGERPTIAFSMGGTLTSDLRLAPVASIGLTGLEAKLQFKTGAILSSVGVVPKTYNYSPGALYSQKVPENGLSMGSGITLQSISTPIDPIVLDPVAVRLTTLTPFAEDTPEPVPVGDPLLLSRDNPTVIGNDAPDLLRAAPGVTFFQNVLVMDGRGGDDILRFVDLDPESTLTQIGGPGNDRIEASGRVEAGTGDDTVEVSMISSNARMDIFLGAGDDHLLTFAPNGTAVRHVDAGEGNDTLFAVGAVPSRADLLTSERGTDGILLLGDGDDMVIGASADFVDLGPGDDLMRGGAAAQLSAWVVEGVNAGTGNDTVSLTLARLDEGEDTRSVLIDGGDGADVLTVQGLDFGPSTDDARDVLVLGGLGDDELVLSGIAAGGDGGAGDDRLRGETFATLSGGAGDDSLVLGEDANIARNITDYDTLAFAQGRTSDLNGGAGRDTIVALIEDTGFDRRAGLRADGGDDDDLIADHLGLARDAASLRAYIAAGDDLLAGGAGNDSVHAGAGADTLLGDIGDDLLTKLSGDASIDAGAGDDTVILSSRGGLTTPGDPDLMLNRLQGGIVTGLAEGGAGTDNLYLDLARLFSQTPVFTRRDAVAHTDAPLPYREDLADARQVTGIEISYDTPTSGRITYLGTLGGASVETRLGTLDFSGFETLELLGLSEQDHLRAFASGAVSVDFSGLGASHATDVTERADRIESYFDSNFGVAGARGTLTSTVLQGRIEAWDTETRLPVDLRYSGVLAEATAERLSPLHPATTERTEYDVLASVTPVAPPDPRDIVAAAGGAGAPVLGTQAAPVMLRPNIARQLQPSDLPVSGGDGDAGDLFYRLVDAPDLGFVARDETMIAAGDGFSGRELAEGRVAYVHMAGAPILRDTAVFEVYDAAGRLASGGAGDGRLPLGFDIDASVRIPGTLSSPQAAIARDGSEITEILFRAAAPVFGTQYIELAASGPAAEAFAGVPLVVVIEHGQSVGRLEIGALTPVNAGPDALILTPVGGSLGLDTGAVGALRLAAVDPAQIRAEGTGSASDDKLLGDVLPVAHVPEISGQVYRLYLATLNREADVTGHRDWSTLLFTGERSLPQIAEGFVGSVEFQSTYGALDDAGFVALMYRNVLGRAPDADGLQGWLGALAAGADRADVVLGFSESPEFGQATQPRAESFALTHTAQLWSDDVFRLYQATLAREPDPGGFALWVAQLGQGTPYADVVAGFVGSPEFQATYGALDNSGFVDLLYRNVLDRAPDAAGRDGWLGVLSGGATRAEVVRGFAQSPEFVDATVPDLVRWMRGLGDDDRIEGRGGINVMAGGFMSDTFVLRPRDEGDHRILDLEPWDRLDLSDFLYVQPERAFQSMHEDGDDVVFADLGVTARFIDTALADITADMLIL